MRVTVLFFAHLKEQFKKSSETRDVPNDITVGALVDGLKEGTRGCRLDMDSIKYAVNEEFVSRNEKLKDLDTLALIPPLSGG